MAVPAGTPHEIVERLSRELVRTLGTPEVAKRFADSGMEVSAGTLEEMAKTIRDEQAFWVPLIRKLGIRVH